MNEKDCIVKTIIQMSGKYSEFEIFTDWVRIMAYSIQNACCIWHDDEWNDREEMYKTVMGKYTKEEQTKLCEMYAWLVEAYDKEISDILGEIFMSKDFGSSMAGQFFTPFHISLMTAKLGLDDKTENDRITMNEPSCGSGGMIVATARALHEKGLPYQKMMDVTAQDLDWNAVYMCYVQLSLLGINAICVQGSTLTNPYDPETTDKRHILKTPRKMGALL